MTWKINWVSPTASESRIGKKGMLSPFHNREGSRIQKLDAVFEKDTHLLKRGVLGCYFFYRIRLKKNFTVILILLKSTRGRREMLQR
jgi:hypothetical protein